MGSPELRPRLFFAIGLTICLGLAGCNRIGLASAPPGGPNLLLVTIDTLRADHVGAYGAELAETPTLDSLASEGVRFDAAFASNPLTLPSHATILTGEYPTRHGVRHNGVYALPDEAVTLTERLGEAGWATGAVVGSVVLAERFGLGQGFDHYDDRAGGPTSGSGGFAERAASEVTDAALAWLASVDEPFFLWVHYYDPHADYKPPEPHASRHPGRPYDGEIAYVDSELGRLLAGLVEPDRTLIVATSDHGESLGEHGESTHAYTLYDAAMRVPLLMRGPGVPRGRVIGGLSRTADIAPTALALLGRGSVADIDGVDLAAGFGPDPGTPPESVYMETLAPRIDHGWAPLFALRTQRHLYVRAPRPELYDSEVDPDQRVNLIGSPAEPAMDGVAELRSGLEARLAQHSEAPSAPNLSLDAETRQQLNALGYALPAAPVAESGLDPKDGLASLADFHRGLRLYDAGQYPAAAAALESARLSLPASAEAHSYLGHAYMQLQQPAKARPILARATELNPKAPIPWAVLGEAHRLLGEPDAALAAYRRAVELDPGEPMARVGLQWAHARRGDLEAAARHASRAAERGPDLAVTWIRVGSVWDEVRAHDRALAAYTRATELAPGLEIGHMLLAISLARQGRFDESDAELGRAGALARDPALASRLRAVRRAAGAPGRGRPAS